MSIEIPAYIVIGYRRKHAVNKEFEKVAIGLGKSDFIRTI